jgi:hypothetical protein
MSLITVFSYSNFRVFTVHDQRSGTIAKSSSRHLHVHASKTKENL